MSQPNSNALPLAASVNIFPQPPLQSSQHAAWKHIYLEHHHQPAYKTPEYCYDWHVIGIHLGRAVTVEMQVEDRSWRKSVVDGDVYLFPAQSWQRVHCLSDSEFVDLHLAPYLFEQIADDAVNLDHLKFAPRFAMRDPFIQQLGLALKTELEAAKRTKANVSDQLYAESMAQALAAHLLRRYANFTQLTELVGGLTPTQLQQVIDYIDAGLAQELSVAAIANLLKLSSFHFSRLFKQTTGLSPYQYILQHRVNRAKQLLQQGQFSIAEVAQSVGFANQSHLHRYFKRYVGITLRQFRNS